MRRAYQFFVLALAEAAAALAMRALAPLQETMRLALSLSDNHMALLQGPALGLPVVIAALPLGLVIDRLSRVRLIFVFAALAAVGSVLGVIAGSFAALFLSRCLVGLAATALIICGFSLLADLYAPEQRGRAKAVLTLGQYAGSSAVFAIGGLLLVAFPLADGWRPALAWLALPPLIVVMLLALTLREPARTGLDQHKGAAPRGFRDAFPALWHHRAMLLFLVGVIVLAEMPAFAIGTWAAPALARTFSLGPEHVGAIMAACTLGGSILGPLLGGTLADVCQRRGGPRRTVTAIALLIALAAPCGLFPLLNSVPFFAFGLGASIVLVSAVIAMGVTLFTIVIPNDLRGLCLSLLAAANSLLAMTLAPLAVSGLSTLLGGPAMIGTALAGVCVVSCLVCALVLIVGRERVPNTAT